ncbi:hypothetical protein TIFTF001_021887 [Ficus carica]|uniref:Uncharacterized protein n=1 Tax=Ficus carica TaxID=3494 RepID=A0AA88DJW2_FICCA|nr:hypothetical protein TIFTF001_021887 [Ficus carica]
MCSDLLFRYPGVKVTQVLDLVFGGIDLIYLKDGCHDGRLGRPVAQFVHSFHVAFPDLFLVSSKDSNTIWVIGRRTVLAARTHWPANPYSGVRAGVITTPLIFGLVNASINKMSVELPLSIRTWRKTFSTIQISPTNFRDVLRHVYIFSPSNLPGLTDITSPATRGVTSGSPSKDGVDNVLGLRGGRLRPAVKYGPADVCNPSSRGRRLCRNCNTCFGSSRIGLFAAVVDPANLPTDVFGLGVGSAPLTPLLIAFTFSGRISTKMSSEQLFTYMTALSKRSRYSFSGSLSPCLILNWYEVFIFWVFAPRNAAVKASASCLNELIDLGINLRYHCRAAPVRVRHKALQRVASLAFWMSICVWINCSDLHQPVPLAHKQVELPLEVIQLVLVVFLFLCWFVDCTISNPILVGPGLSQAIEHGGCAPAHVHGIPPLLVRVISSQSCWWCDCSRVSGLVVAALRAFSTRVILLVSQLVPHVPPRWSGYFFGQPRVTGSAIYWPTWHSHGLGQALDIPVEDFHLPRVVKALDVLAGPLVHGFFAVRLAGNVGGKVVVAEKAGPSF